jgi:hypothetical protein
MHYHMSSEIELYKIGRTHSQFERGSMNGVC